jgi:hypothetical protein
MRSFAENLHARAPIGVPTELPAAGTWLENPFVYDAAARTIKAMAAEGRRTEIVSERQVNAGGQPVTVHLVFRRVG